jgi:hypothetical protein
MFTYSRAVVRNVDTSELLTEMALLPSHEAGMFISLAQLVGPVQSKLI